jgi:hypothetical protein
MTKAGDSQTKKTLHELAKEFPNKTYKELEKYKDADRQEEALGIGGIGHNHPPDLVEVMAIENEKLKKRAQEAEGELSIMKGIETNRVKEAQTRSNQLQDELDRVKKENNDLYNKIADLTEVAKSKDYFRDPDYQYLIDQNRILEEERNKLLTDNKKLAAEIEDRIARARESGL